VQRSSSVSTITSVPSAIWKERWVPTTGPYLGLGLSSLENISDDVYEAASGGHTMEELDVRALDMAGLVDAFKNILATSLESYQQNVDFICESCYVTFSYPTLNKLYYEITQCVTR
jgi:hypothetical protein